MCVREREREGGRERQGKEGGEEETDYSHENCALDRFRMIKI